MRSIGPLYGTIVKYPHRPAWPIVETGWSQEIEEPYRKGSCLVFRVPFTKPGFAIGVFTASLSEEDALTNAIKSRVHDVEVKELEDWDSARTKYAGDWTVNEYL